MTNATIFTPSFNAEGTAVIHGVNVRRTDLSVKTAPLFHKQRIVTETRHIQSGEYEGYYIKAELRFDDECGNGHNSFAITGEISSNRSFTERGHVTSGCIHEEIAAHFPELAHLIKWHLCSTDSPMHYVANTVYHASDRDHQGKRKGEPTRFEENLYFSNFPIAFGGKKPVRDMLKSKTYGVINDSELVVIPVPHSDKGISGKYQFEDKYTFAGCACNWTYAPFNSRAEAEQWAQAIKLGYRFESVPVAWSAGKERDFDAARRCGVWPDATDEQLSMEPELLKAALLERLPALVEAMKSDITGAGFLWGAE